MEMAWQWYLMIITEVKDQILGAERSFMVIKQRNKRGKEGWKWEEEGVQIGVQQRWDRDKIVLKWAWNKNLLGVDYGLNRGGEV